MHDGNYVACMHASGLGSADGCAVRTDRSRQVFPAAVVLPAIFVCQAQIDIDATARALHCLCKRRTPGLVPARPRLPDLVTPPENHPDQQDCHDSPTHAPESLLMNASMRCNDNRSTRNRCCAAGQKLS